MDEGWVACHLFFDELFLILVDLFVPFEEDPVSIGEIECSKSCTDSESFDSLFDDGIGHGVFGPLPAFGFLANGKVHELVRALLVPGRSKNDSRATAGYHPIRRIWFFVGFNVASKEGSAVFLEIEFVPINNLTRR